MDPHRPLVLVLTPHPETKPGIKKHLLGGHFSTIETPTVAFALELVDTHRIVGAIADLDHEDGMHLLELLRQRDSRLPLLALSRDVDVDCINRSQLIDADFVVRRRCRPNLRQFTRKVSAHTACSQDNLSGAVSQYAHQKGLSAREAQVLAAAASGVPRSHLCRSLGCSENTVKSYIRSLLAKSDMGTLADLIWWLRSYDQLYTEQDAQSDLREPEVGDRTPAPESAPPHPIST